MDKDKNNLDAPSFQLGDYGIKETQTMSLDEVDNFLNSDPDVVSRIEDENEDDDKPAPKSAAKPVGKKQAQKPEPKKAEEIQEEEEEEASEDDVIKNALGDEEEEEINQVKEKNKKIETKPEEEEETTSEDDNTFKAFTRELIDLGVFEADEDDTQPVDTPEKFLDRFNREVQKKGINWIENFLGNFGPDRKALFDAIFFNGVEPVDYLRQFTKVEGLQNLDLSIESNQERVLRLYYSTLPGWDNDRINSKIEKLKSYAGLDEEANEKYEILVAQEQAALANQEEDSKRRIAEKDRMEREYLSNVQRILTDKLKTKDFDGIPISQEFANQTASYLTQNRYKLPNGELLTEFDKELLDLRRPENHEKKVKLAMLLQMIKSDPTLSKLKKVAVTSETNELFSSLRKDKKVPQKKNNDQITTWF